jgi:hypothetical protein
MSAFDPATHPYTAAHPRCSAAAPSLSDPPAPLSDRTLPGPVRDCPSSSAARAFRGGYSTLKGKNDVP